MGLSMYPEITQFATRQLVLERELRLIREVDTARTRSVTTGALRPPVRPRRYKLAVLNWGAAYAVITLIVAFLGPTMASWPLAIRTLVLSAGMVVSLTWLLMPALTRLFDTWLNPTA